MSATNPSARRQWAWTVTTTLAGIAIVLGLLWWVGLAFMPVRSGSMQPTFYPGDAVIGVSPRLVSPRVGDVVVAHPIQGDQQLPPIAHRIIESTPQGFRTQGDANPNPDAWFVRPADISHTVVAAAPLRFLRSPIAVAIAVGLVALVLLWPRRPKDAVPAGQGQPWRAPEQQRGYSPRHSREPVRTR